MTYVPIFPLSGSLISAAPAQFQINFTQANNIFGVDHSTFEVSGAPGTGYHKRVTFGAVSSDPNQAAPICSLYTKTVGSSEQLFFQNGSLASNVIQITSAGGFQTYTPVVTGAASFTGATSNGYFAVVGGVTQFTITGSYTGATGPFSPLTVTLPSTASSTGGSFMFTGISTAGTAGPFLISSAATTISNGVNVNAGPQTYKFSGFYI